MSNLLDLSLAGLLVVLSLANAPSGGLERAAERSATAHWRAELISSGGITGKGTGGVTVSSDGTAELLQLGSKSACTTKLTMSQIAALDSAVTNITQEQWDAGALKSNTAPCCDRFQWNLRVTRADSSAGEQQLVSSWTADSAEAEGAPAGIAAVHEALVALWPTIRSACSTNR
jgi:hypothetical protein